MMRLVPALGRPAAHRLLYEAAQQAQTDGTHLLAAVESHPLAQGRNLTGTLADALDPGSYVGQSATIAAETAQRLIRKWQRVPSCG